MTKEAFGNKPDQAPRNRDLGTAAYMRKEDIIAEAGGSPSWDDVTDKPNIFPPAPHSHNISDINDFPNLAPVATSGAYTDLSGTPTLATVATTGSYNDLSDKPVIGGGGGDGAVSFLTVAEFVTWTGTNSPSNGVSVWAGDARFVRDTSASIAGIPAGWRPAGKVTVKHFGAIGDWDGSAGTDDTTAFNNALDWFAAEGNRSLHIPDGWYYYNGSRAFDLQGSKWSYLTCDGAMYFAATSGVSWTFHNFKESLIQVNLFSGGATGDFTDITPVGGSTAIQYYDTQWIEVRVHAQNYLGRVLHGTSVGDARNVRTKVYVTFGERGNSLGNDFWNEPFAPVGQPLFFDTNTASNNGGTGEFYVRGSACVYGPVFERCTDVTITDIECGPFNQMGMEMRGCNGVRIEHLWLGESTQTNATPAFSAIPTSGGLQCSGFFIDVMRVFRCTGGAVFRDFAPNIQGVVINQFSSVRSDGYGLQIEDVPKMLVKSISAKGDTVAETSLGAVKIDGSCGHIDLHLNSTIGLEGDVIQLNGTVNHLIIKGQATGSGPGYSLINLGNWVNRVSILDMDLNSSTADQLIRMGNASTLGVHHVGGAVTAGGSTDIYNDPRRPGVMNRVRNLPYPDTFGGDTSSGAAAINATQSLTGALAYSGFTRLAGHTYGGSIAPSASTQLNYDGYFRSTRLQSVEGATVGGFLTVDGGASFGSGTSVAGGLTVTSGINLSNSRCFNMADPTVAQHGATKGYVDAQVSASDYRLKENLRDPLDKTYEVLDALRFYAFDWKDGSGSDVGGLAHELAEILPDAVIGEKDGEETQRVRYDRLVPYLMVALKDALARIDELEKSRDA